MIRTLFICLSLSGFVVGAQEEKVYRIGDGVSAPVLIYKVEPKYTEEARDARLEGAVVLSMEVSRAGDPEKLKVVKSLEAGLDRKALEAVQQWRFKPGTKDDMPVRVKATIEVNFRLK